MSLQAKVITFLQEAKVLTYCTVVDDQPHCAPCYFSFLEEDGQYYLLFKSSEETQHIQEALINPKVAGSVLPNRKMEVSSNQGVQFKGKFILEEEERMKLKKAYYAKFSYARAVPGEVWAIELIETKMTDNTLGFGKKLKWVKNN
ncbi:MAG: hypothetical protein CMC96_06210 [Flavobacteriales bacterium]|nr:hypothetical protein [Flavobacteriales bacterium]|tara:strand:- start:11508 stop:11942 length:435 start_codon:yes stop_codon:yes gene_type:complete